jgi:hypothetical protein
MPMPMPLPVPCRSANAQGCSKGAPGARATPRAGGLADRDLAQHGVEFQSAS